MHPDKRTPQNLIELLDEERVMSIWIILHHHRHGIDVHAIRSASEPTAEQIEKGLAGRGWEPDEGEWYECLPVAPTELADFVEDLNATDLEEC